MVYSDAIKKINNETFDLFEKVQVKLLTLPFEFGYGKT